MDKTDILFIAVVLLGLLCLHLISQLNRLMDTVAMAAKDCWSLLTILKERGEVTAHEMINVTKERAEAYMNQRSIHCQCDNCKSKE